MAKRILIVGNSDGIGAATTAALVARGESVVGVSRSPSSLMPPARGDESHRHEVMDVTDPAYPALLGRLVQETGPFDACIYCVGVGAELELSDLSHETMVFDVNLTAMVRTLEILLPPWLERRAGHFIGLSSMADTLLNPGAPAYSASKAGFSNYLLGMALRLRSHGIAVTNVRFGFVDTKMAKAVRKPLIMTVDPDALLPTAPAELLHQRDRPIPRGRPRAVPRDVRRPGRWDDDRCTPRPRRFIDGDRVIGGVSGEAHERALDRGEQIEASGRIIPRRLGQRVDTDHAGLIDTKVEPPPATPAAATVFRGRPLTGPESVGRSWVPAGTPGCAHT